MKSVKGFAVVMAGLAVQTSVMANESVLTAHVSAQGTVLRQSPQWIVSVDHQPQPNYLSLYTLKLNKRIVQRDPGFCTVSPIDASSYERQLYGQAKVIGRPKSDKVDVMTHLVDKNGPSGDNALEFLVMCSR